MRFSTFLSFAAATASLVAGAQGVQPTRTTKAKKWDKGFVTVEGTQFIRNGEPFRFVGTNAYWLASLNNDADINKTIHDIASRGISVIRTWAFNDVDTIPENGTWFQVIANGTTSVNLGPTGLQRLDKVVQFAEEAGVLLIMSLTNNWNPRPLLDNTTVVPVDGLTRRDVTTGTNNSLPRNFLSNDYGGMDAYVREFGSGTKEHDQFYLTDGPIIDIFKNYTNQVVNRYKDSPAILAWELANDARCNSSIPAAASCDTLTVTNWHANVSQHVRAMDPNHIVSSGTQGFICTDCPKMFPLAPKPQPSASVRKAKKSVKPLTTERLLKERRERRKQTRALKKRELLERGEGLRIRGRWIATRQAETIDSTMGPAFDGSSGVDAQDILNSPNIGFGSFQLFPDQNVYGTPDPNLPAFNNTVEEGINFIKIQGQLAQIVGKPTILNAFGLVTQDNAPFFVPFNSTIAPFNGTAPPTTATKHKRQNAPTVNFGVTNAQQDDAYTQWITAAAQNGVGGVVQYQWGQGSLTPQDGSIVSPNNAASDTVPNDSTSDSSPNDGYQSAPTGSDGVASVLTSLTSLFG